MYRRFFLGAPYYQTPLIITTTIAHFPPSRTLCGPLPLLLGRAPRAETCNSGRRPRAADSHCGRGRSGGEHTRRTSNTSHREADASTTAPGPIPDREGINTPVSRTPSRALHNPHYRSSTSTTWPNRPHHSPTTAPLCAAHRGNHLPAGV